MSILFAQGPYTLSFDLSQFGCSGENGYDREKGIEMPIIMDINTNTPEIPAKSHSSKQPILWQLQRTETFKIDLKDAFAIDPVPGLVYAVGDSGYIIKHDPVTNNWIRLNSPTSVNLTGLFFLNASKGWVCGENGVILHTNNGGNTWEFQYPPTTSSLSDIQFLNSQVGFALVRTPAANTGTLLWTTNGGTSWGVRAIPNLPSGPEFVLSNLTFVSETEGWVTGYLWEAILKTEELVWDRFPPGIIYHTTDGGSSWVDQTPTPACGYSEICFIDNLKGWVVGHTSYYGLQHLFYTSNGGNSWSIQLSWEGPIIDVCFDDANIGWLLVRRNYDLFNFHPAVLRTTNGGANWLDDQSFNCHSWRVNQITTSPGLGWVVGDWGLVMSGKMRVWNIQTWGGGTLSDVSFLDARNGWIHGALGMILRTTNCGAIWKYQFINSQEAELIGTGIDFIDNQRGWTCGFSSNGFIAYTSDGGNNWNYIAQLYRQKLSDIDFVDENKGWTVSAYMLGPSTIWHSSNGGYNWNRQLESHSFSRIRFFDQNYGWAVEPPISNLWFTPNGGDDWYRRPLEKVWVDVCPLTPDTAWIVGVEPITRNPKVGFTSDQGLTWDIKILNHPGQGGRGIEFIDPTFGWVAGDKGLILGTVDAGKSWFKEETGVETELLEICFPDPYHGYAVGDRGTVLYRYLPFNLSSSGLSTAYQSPKIVRYPTQQNFWTVYQSANHIFVSLYNENNALHRKLLSEGEFPCVALNLTNNPCVIWQKNVEPTPHIGGGELWFSRYDGTNWSEPYLLASFVGPFNLDVNLPSFMIDPATNTGYVVFEWRDRFINGPNSHLWLGWFDVNNPANIQFRELEYAPNPARCEFPSISQGGNYLYIAFQREHKIFRIKWDIINQQIDDRDQVSQDGRFSHHPYVDIEASGRINYVWEDSTAENIEIMWWHENPAASEIKNVSETPGKSQWPQICKGTTWITWSEFIWPPTDNNWEICYKDMEYEGYQILSQTIGMSKHSHGVITRSPYWPPSYEPKLTAIWTEGNRAPYEIRAKTVIIPTPAYFYVDGGRETPSPWTVQREGYIQFAPDPEKTIDYDAQRLIYNFPNLNPEKRYRIKLVFYFESQGNNRWRMKIDGDNIFHANLWIKPKEITTLERWLPTACYADGEIYLNITKIIGDYALVAQVVVYEYNRNSEEISKNTQESQTQKITDMIITVQPNPFSSKTEIILNVPEDKTVSLKIYDISGRLVKDFSTIFNTGNQFHVLLWNGRDSENNILPSGTYFLIAEAERKRACQKLLFVK